MFPVYMTYQRSVKHSHLYKNVDGSNAYIRKDHFNGEEPPEEIRIDFVPPKEGK